MFPNCFLYRLVDWATRCQLFATPENFLRVFYCCFISVAKNRSPENQRIIFAQFQPHISYGHVDYKKTFILSVWPAQFSKRVIEFHHHKNWMRILWSMSRVSTKSWAPIFVKCFEKNSRQWGRVINGLKYLFEISRISSKWDSNN